MLNENFLLVGALLLFIAVLAGKVAYRLGAPALLLFLGVGMVFGYNDFIPFHSYEFTQFIGMIALCIILFSGGMDTKFSQIRPVMTAGVVLATLGVVATALIVGGFVYFVAPYVGIEMSFVSALLLAATMSSTDSASVFSILRSKKQGLRQNLRPMLELESGSNDPMAYILTVLLVSLAGGGGHGDFDWVDTLRTFAVQMIVGSALGYMFGRASVWIINRINIHSNQSLYSIMLLACAFFSFSFTTLAYGNGYLAVYITGLVVGNYRIVHRHMLMTFFDSFTWLLQIVLFLALGLLVDVNELLQPDVVIMGLAVGAFMIFFARPVATLLLLAPFKHFTAKARIYVSWVGLRGAVPIIFATYPVLEGVQNAEYIFNVVFLVTIISLVVQGTTVSGMANWLGLAYEELESVFKLNMPDSVKSEFSEIEVNESLLVQGDTLKEIKLPGGTLVVMICRGGKYFVPQGHTRLAAGDKLLVVSDNNEELILKAKSMGVEKFIRVE